MDDPTSFIQACAQCVDGQTGAEGRGGSLFVSTMNRTRKAQLMAVVGAEYVLGMVPPGTTHSVLHFHVGFTSCCKPSREQP